jgi:hypothetical protein
VHGQQLAVSFVTPGSVTDVLEALPVDSSYHLVNNNPGFTPSGGPTFATVSYTNNTAKSVPIVVNYSALIGVNVVSGTNQLFNGTVRVDNNGSVTSVGSFDGSFGQFAQTAGAGHLFAGVSNVITVAAGTTCTVELRGLIGRLAPGIIDATFYWAATRLNLQGIRK